MENPLHRAAWPGTRLDWGPMAFSPPLGSLSHVPDKHLSQSHQLQVVMIDSLVLLTDNVQCRTVISSQQNHRPPFVRRPITKTKLQQLRPPLPPPAIERVCIIQQSKAMPWDVRASPSSNAHARLVLTSKISFFHPPCSYSNSLCSASLPSISHSRTKLPGA